MFMHWKGSIVALLLVNIIGCSGDETASDGDNPTEKPFADRVFSLEDFETSFNDKQVSDISPTGTWVIYASGDIETSHQSANEKYKDLTKVNLLAAVVSIFVIKGEAGTDDIIVRNCTGESPSNAAFVASTLEYPSFNQFTLKISDIQQFFILSENLFTTYGELQDQQAYDAFLDREITIRLDNNVKLLFPYTITFTNSTDVVTKFNYDFKGIKISDNLDIILGKFNTNQSQFGELNESHCFNFRNATQTKTATDLTGQETYSETLNKQAYNVYTLQLDEPGKLQYPYSINYTGVGPHTYKSDGTTNIKEYPTETLTFSRTTDKSVYTYIEATNSKSINITTTFDYTEGFTMNFSAYPGTDGELSGMVEAFLP